ncbi:MAG: glutamate 5-kinase [Deltaproteobacteria bacterium]|jgi:glutamate 5-kinase|nr:glutamate 5-kinase [Deltaproteobacteria bacterium]
MLSRADLRNARRLVVKIGSSQLCENDRLSLGRFRALARQVAQLRRRGLEVVLVSSGAVAAGVAKLGLPARPATLRMKQVCASAGQVSLMVAWEKALSAFDLKCAQILLTASDLDDRRGFLNTRNTLASLMEMGVVPIVNENDTVAVEELRFGDNDSLGSLVASLVSADVFINLTDSDGLFAADPRTSPGAALIPEVTSFDESLLARAAAGGPMGTGGMHSKLVAAALLSAKGTASIIANGRARDVLERLVDGEELGTIVRPSGKPRKARWTWLAFSARPRGQVVVDGGAAAALVGRGKSLLPGGVVAAKGLFKAGDPVAVMAAGGERLGIGLSNYSVLEIERIMGHPSASIEGILGYSHSDEVIHRDNLVILVKP